jgi:hypothetical protein
MTSTFFGLVYSQTVGIFEAENVGTKFRHYPIQIFASKYFSDKNCEFKLFIMNLGSQTENFNET